LFLYVVHLGCGFSREVYFFRGFVVLFDFLFYSCSRLCCVLWMLFFLMWFYFIFWGLRLDCFVFIHY